MAFRLDLSKGCHWSADRPSGPMFNFYNIFEFNGPSNPQATRTFTWNWDSLNRPTLLGEKVGLSVISDKSQKGDSWRHIETAEESHLKGKVEESQTHFTEPALISVISYLVLETFSKSSSERVPSEVRHCRITSDIFTKEFLTSRQPRYTVWRLVED